MGKIDAGRVLLGGLLAGLVVNITEFVLNGVVLKEEWASVMKAINRPAEFTTAQMAGFVAWGFVFGILGVWLYAAIRPRFGAGPGTAVTAGFALWMLGNLMPNGFLMMMGTFPTNLLLIGIAVGLVEAVVAIVLGAAVYHEAATQEDVAAAAGAGR